MQDSRPLMSVFAGLSLLSSVSAPELSIVITAFALVLFGWRFWLLCNAVAWWTVWDFLLNSVAFTRFVLAAAGLTRIEAWALAALTVGGGIVLAVLLPSYLISRFALPRIAKRLPKGLRSRRRQTFS